MSEIDEEYRTAWVEASYIVAGWWITEQEDKMIEQGEEQKYLENESAKAIADNEAMIEEEHQREIAEELRGNIAEVFDSYASLIGKMRKFLDIEATKANCVNKILALIKEDGYLSHLADMPENILITKGNEHPEERIPFYKPKPNRLLTEEEWLDIWASGNDEKHLQIYNDYLSGLIRQDAKTASIVQAECQAKVEKIIDECFDYFSAIVRSDKVIVNLLDQLEIKRQALKARRE